MSVEMKLIDRLEQRVKLLERWHLYSWAVIKHLMLENKKTKPQAAEPKSPEHPLTPEERLELTLERVGELLEECEATIKHIRNA